MFHISNFQRTGQICDENSTEIPFNTPPTAHDSDWGPDDWTPYNNRAKFEHADFVYCCNQMSGGNINVLLDIWASTLAPHGAEPPFHNHNDLYNTINSTPLGDIPWKSFSVKYDGAVPDGERVFWMDTEYEAWFQDPWQPVASMLSNPDFMDEIDFTPFHEYDKEGNHCFHNFMSGDWVWKQAVSDATP